MVHWSLVVTAGRGEPQLVGCCRGVTRGDWVCMVLSGGCGCWACSQEHASTGASMHGAWLLVDRWAMQEKSGCHAWAMHGLCWTKVGLVQCCFGLAKMDLKKKVKGPRPKKKLTQDNKNKIIIINKIKR